MGFGDALSTYTLLTVGDGLVAQIPALLISTAAGIIVTRGGRQTRTSAPTSRRRCCANPRPLSSPPACSALFGLVPGLPKLPFLLLSAVLGDARLGHPQEGLRTRPTRSSPIEAAEAQKAPPAPPDAVTQRRSSSTRSSWRSATA